MIMKNIGFAAVLVAVLFLSIAYTGITGAHAKEAAAPQVKTLENLMTAYNGESNANVRYLAFAKKASEEGYDTAASLFRAAARAEQVHYERHAEVIKKLGGTPNAVIETPIVKSTQENLESAIKGETYEKDVMYPAFLEQAKKDNIKDAVDAFEDAGAAEGVHAQLYTRMLQNLTLSKGLIKFFYVCPLCGNVIDAITSSVCPICFTDTKKFIRVK